LVAGTGHAGWLSDRQHGDGLTGEAQVRIWRLLGVVLAVPVMLGGLLLVTAEPAAGCTCVQMTEAQHAASVKTVFVGALVDSRVDPSVLTRKYREARLRERDARSTFRNLDPVVLTFEVSRVYKGAVGKRQEIVIPPGPPGTGPAGSMFPRVWGVARVRISDVR
jgi:hypothetical protein